MNGQTALVITLPDGSELLVTVAGRYVPADLVRAAHRDVPWQSWGPPLPVEVRHEGGVGNESLAAELEAHLEALWGES